jgi:hypothetical protein
VGPRVMVEVKVVEPGWVMICVMMTSLTLSGIGVVRGLSNGDNIAILLVGFSLSDCTCAIELMGCKGGEARAVGHRAWKPTSLLMLPRPQCLYVFNKATRPGIPPTTTSCFYPTYPRSATVKTSSAESALSCELYFHCINTHPTTSAAFPHPTFPTKQKKKRFTQSSSPHIISPPPGKGGCAHCP